MGQAERGVAVITGGSSGLGLAMAYRIVTEHDGFIDAENGPGGGARIVIRLPLAAASTPTREESA